MVNALAYEHVTLFVTVKRIYRPSPTADTNCMFNDNSDIE